MNFKTNNPELKFLLIKKKQRIRVRISFDEFPVEKNTGNALSEKNKHIR